MSERTRASSAVRAAKLSFEPWFISTSECGWRKRSLCSSTVSSQGNVSFVRGLFIDGMTIEIGVLFKHPASGAIGVALRTPRQQQASPASARLGLWRLHGAA